MRLYSKAFTGKQLNWRDGSGETWTLTGDAETGELLWAARGTQYTDGDGILIVPVNDSQYAYPDGTLVPSADVHGASPSLVWTELPLGPALELLADPSVGKFIWEDPDQFDADDFYLDEEELDELADEFSGVWDDLDEGAFPEDDEVGF